MQPHILIALLPDGQVNMTRTNITPKMALQILGGAIASLAQQLPNPEAQPIQIATADEVPPAPNFVNRLNGRK